MTNRSSYIWSDSAPVKVAPLYSHADTLDQSGGAALGDRAGIAELYKSMDSFSFKADDFGFIVIVNSIQPITGNFEGLPRQEIDIADW